MPSSHLILCCPLLLLFPILPSIRVFFNESTLCMRWPKYWSFSFSISPSNEHSGPISPRMDWLDLFAVQGTLKSLLQHHSSWSSLEISFPPFFPDTSKVITFKSSALSQLCQGFFLTCCSLSMCLCACVLSHFSCVQLFASLWTVAHLAPLSMGFSRQEYWSELPCLPPGDLSNPGIEPAFPAALAFQADSLLLSHWGSPCMCLPALFVPGELYVKYLYVLLLYDPLSWKSMWLCLQLLIDGTLLRTFWEFLCWVIILSWLQ